MDLNPLVSLEIHVYYYSSFIVELTQPE